MDVSKNMGTPKWMVKIMENPIRMDDLGVPLFLETPIWYLLYIKLVVSRVTSPRSSQAWPMAWSISFVKDHLLFFVGNWSWHTALAIAIARFVIAAAYGRETVELAKLNKDSGHTWVEPLVETCWNNFIKAKTRLLILAQCYRVTTFGFHGQWPSRYGSLALD